MPVEYVPSDGDGGWLVERAVSGTCGYYKGFFMKPLKDVASGGNRECVNGFIVSKPNLIRNE